MWQVPASDLLSAIFQGYNDYLSDFCSTHPNRLKGIAMVNVDSVEDAVGGDTAGAQEGNARGHDLGEAVAAL